MKHAWKWSGFSMKSASVPCHNDFSVQDSYFACATSDYAIFRAKLSERDSLNAVYLPSLKANLSRLLAREDKTQITINGTKYVLHWIRSMWTDNPRVHFSTLLGQYTHTTGCCFHFSSREHCHNSCGHHVCCIGPAGARRVPCCPCHWTAEKVYCTKGTRQQCMFDNLQHNVYNFTMSDHVILVTGKPTQQKWRLPATWNWHQRVAPGPSTGHMAMSMCTSVQRFPFSATQAIAMEWQSSLAYPLTILLYIQYI